MNNELNQTGGDHEASGAGQRGRWACLVGGHRGGIQTGSGAGYSVVLAHDLRLHAGGRDWVWRRQGRGSCGCRWGGRWVWPSEPPSRRVVTRSLPRGRRASSRHRWLALVPLVGPPLHLARSVREWGGGVFLSMSSSASTQDLAVHLTALPDREVAALLVARPDLAAPPSSSFLALATRAVPRAASSTPWPGWMRRRWPWPRRWWL